VTGRRLLASVAVLAGVLLGGLPGGPPAASAAPAPADGGAAVVSSGPVRVLLDVVDWDTGGTGPLRIAGRIQLPAGTAGSAVGLSVTVGLGQAVTSRDQLDRMRADPASVTGGGLARQAVPGTLAPGGSLGFTVPPVPLPSLRLAAQLTVHPVTVAVTGTVGGVARQLGQAVTFIVTSPGTARARTPIAIVLPLVDQPRLAPDGSLTDDGLAIEVAPGGRLTRLLDAVLPDAGQPAPAVSLAVDPELVRSLTVMAAKGGYRVTAGGHVVTRPSNPDAATFLRNLRLFAAGGGSVLALPYADADVVALTRAGQLNGVRVAVFLGRQVLAAALGGRAPVGTVAIPAGGFVDARTLGLLHGNGVTTVVTSEAALPAAADRIATPTAVTTVPVPGGTMRALVADDGLAAVVAAGPRLPAGAALASYRAETAMITAEAPAVARPQVLSLPRGWDPPAAWLGEVLANVSTRWSAAWPLAKVASSAPADREALTFPAAAAAAALPAPVTQAAAGWRAQVLILRAVLCGSGTNTGGGTGAAMATGTGSAPRPVPTATPAAETAARTAACEKDGYLDQLNDSVLSTESAAWRGDVAAGGALSAHVASQITGHLDSIRLVASRIVTLTSRTGRVPVTLENDLSSPVSVLLRLSAPDPARLEGGSTAARTVGAHQKVQVEIEVHAQSAGTFPVQIALLTPAGQPLSSQPPTRILVRSTVYGVIATVITVCALGVLALAVVVRSVRRVRAARGTRQAPPPPGTGEPSRTAGTAAVSGGGGPRPTGGGT
jgi:Family of unknown function (DUF6049)